MVENFSFGAPLPPEYLFGREEEISKIMKRVLTITQGIRNDVVLIGPRRVGKSSILNYIEAETLKHKIIPIKIDCEGLDFISFLKEYGNAILDMQLKNLGIMKKFRAELKKGFTSAIIAMSEALGKIKSVEVSSPIAKFLKLRIEFEEAEHKGSPNADEINELFERTMKLPETLNHKFVILFDEFQETSSYSLPRGSFHANFRSIIQNQRNVCYVYTGSAIGMIQNVFGDPLNPLAGNAEMIYIAPFSSETTISFLKTRFKEAKRKITDSCAAQIYLLTGGFPSYLNWMGLRICDFVPENSDVKEEIIQKVYTEMNSNTSPVYQMIERQLAKLGASTRKIIHTLSLGYSTASDIEKESNVKNVYVYLDRLEKYGIVKKEDKKYLLIDPVMKDYFKYK